MAVLLLLVVVPLSIFLLVRGIDSAGKQLLIEHTPTSDCGGVSPGLVELSAEVVAEDPLDSPLTDREVVYYEASVDERVEDTDDGSRSWEELGEKSGETAFYVHDETGRVRVSPESADIHAETAVETTARSGHSLWERGPDGSLANSVGKRRFKEEHIAVGDEVYILGTVRDRQHLGVPEIGSGEINDPFIISTDDESDLVDKFRSQTRQRLTLGTLCALAVPTLLVMIVEGAPLGEAFGAAFIPTFFVGLVVVGMLWMTYRLHHRSHIDDLKERMERARAIQRREGEHRAELVVEIAQLINDAVGVDHEDFDVEIDGEEITVRGRYSARAVCDAIDAQSAALASLFDIAREIPELQSDDEFYETLEELTRCEKQLMMARNFYNEGRWRLSQQPESRVGETGRTSSPMIFEPFERKPVDVVLPEDPDSEYAGDFERDAAEADAAEATDGADAEPSVEQTKEETPPEVPETPEEANEESAETSEIDDEAVEDSETEAREPAVASDAGRDDESADEPPEMPDEVEEEFDDAAVEGEALEQSIVTHEPGKLGVSMSFEGLSSSHPFGEGVDDERLDFGGGLDFADLRGVDDGEEETGEFGFGDGFGSAGKLGTYAGFGFDAADEKRAADSEFGGFDATDVDDEFGFTDEEKAEAAKK